MLVLSRKVKEAIMIGDTIRIVVLSIRGNRVRLGIEAPDEVPVMRGELMRVGCEPDCDATTDGTLINANEH